MPEAAHHLSPHFTVEELCYSETAQIEDIDNKPTEEVLAQLHKLANITLEGIRKICGDNPVEISSGYRCPQLNAVVGGASNSAHLFGCAADISIPAFGDPLAVCKALESHLPELGIDQLIYETSSNGGKWVHVGRAIPPSTAPRCQCFSIINGATVYSPFPQ